METCYVGIGSNLGKRKQNINRAIDFLRQDKNIKIKKISSLIETAPLGGPPQAKFLNGVLKIETGFSPRQLLAFFKNVEQDLGRTKTVKWGPRIVDLDILLYGNANVNEKKLKIPHPRMWQRDFVLKPLAEIAPQVIGKVKTFRRIDEIRKYIRAAKKNNQTLGFVPTMGYLHAGHLSLIKAARKDCDIVVISIFVNPAQFGPGEDLKRYPRDFKRDAKLAHACGVDAIFFPAVDEIYPAGFTTHVEVERFSAVLCGASRPGHFKGVATVVLKLFNIVQPDIAYFGGKDAQQAVIIRRMAKDLNLDLEIKVLPIVREPDGLAMSSRNTYLNPSPRSEAALLYQSLQKAKQMIKSGEGSSQKLILTIKKMISRIKRAKIDYIQIVDAESLAPLETVKGKVLIALAVWMGKTRLIDNIIVNVKK